MENLELRRLDENDETAYLYFIKELTDIDGSVTPYAASMRGPGGQYVDLSFKDWLSRTRKNSKGEMVFEGWVPSTILFLFHKNQKKILGAVDIRHELNDFLLGSAGNIGYGVTPSERRKGYAGEMLKMALGVCRKMGMKKALVTCNKENIGSAKTIIKNGGILENEVEYGDGRGIRQRYWIKL